MGTGKFSIMPSGEPFVRVTRQVRSGPSSASERAAFPMVGRAFVFSAFVILAFVVFTFVLLSCALLILPPRPPRHLRPAPELLLRSSRRRRAPHDQRFGFLAREFEPVEDSPAA